MGKIFKKDGWELLAVSLILFLALCVRFIQLGYSNFYGDETKTFYLDKTVPAHEFFLNQRKGPIQFFVVWVVEKIFGGFDETWTRVPFAITGFLAVLAFYLLVRKMFGSLVAIISTILFAFGGFFVAFSRTAQYQSFLILFGFLGIYAFLKHLTDKSGKYLVVSVVSFVLAMFSHYDAVFFLIPVFFIGLQNKFGFLPQLKKTYILAFLIGVSIFSLFFVPYIVSGNMQKNTFGYFERRIVGSGFSQNNSLYTYMVYNPGLLPVVFLVLSFLVFFVKDWSINLRAVFMWFFVPFVCFQFLVLNPGTHVLNYFIPLYILAGFGAQKLLEKFKYPVILRIGYVAVGAYIVIFSFLTFVPALSNGYPWENSINKNYHLFLYGFPYNRGWGQIKDYFAKKEGVRGVFTNDNDTIAQYYLGKFDYTLPGSGFLPQYYIHIFGNQEFTHFPMRGDFELMFNSNYVLEKEFFVAGRPVAQVFKLTGGSQSLQK